MLGTFRLRLLPCGSLAKWSQVRGLTVADLPESHIILQKTCRDFANTELKPIAYRLEAEQRFPAQQLRRLGDLGLVSLLVPKELGGSGRDHLAVCVALEEVARGCPLVADRWVDHTCLYLPALVAWSNKTQRIKYLRPFLDGRSIGSFAFLEPDRELTLDPPTATARQEGNNWILNGKKGPIRNVLEAKVSLVFASTSGLPHERGVSAFLVPNPSLGLRVIKQNTTLGLGASLPGVLHFTDCRLHLENILGPPGQAMVLVEKLLDKGRLGRAAESIGIGLAALDCMIATVCKQESYGGDSSKFHYISDQISDLSTRLRSARQVIHRTAVRLDKGEKVSTDINMARQATLEIAFVITNQATQILNTMSHAGILPQEERHRDAIMTEIFDANAKVSLLHAALQRLKKREVRH